MIPIWIIWVAVVGLAFTTGLLIGYFLVGPYHWVPGDGLKNPSPKD